MRQALSRRKWSFRAPLLAFAIATLATFGFAGSCTVSPALAQTPGSVTLSLFDPELADVRPSGFDEITNATSCYPTATFNARVPTGDPLTQDSLGKARVEALSAALKKLGLVPDQFKLESSVTGSDDVVVSYPDALIDKDKDGPILKTSSMPLKGSKVKAGDTIMVTMTASERFEDGHASWPSGVLSIQLRERDGLRVADPDPDYGPIPVACERRTKTLPYLVPSPAPAIVHLQAYAVDGIGNESSEFADFPTGDWYGTFKAHTQGNIYNDDASVEFSFSADKSGAITGKGRARVSSAPQVFTECTYTHTITPSEFDVDIGGQFDGEQFKLEMSQGGPAIILFNTTGCSGSRPSPPGKLQTPFVAASQSFFHPRVRAEDRAANTLHSNDGAKETTGRIEIHSTEN